MAFPPVTSDPVSSMTLPVGRGRVTAMRLGDGSHALAFALADDSLAFRVEAPPAEMAEKLRALARYLDGGAGLQAEGA